MSFYKKILLYFRTKTLVLIARHTLLAIVVCLFLLFINEMNNRKRVYENLDKIVVGENIYTAIKKMKHFIVFLNYETLLCNDCFNDNNFIYQVVFKHKYYKIASYQYSRVYL